MIRGDWSSLQETPYLYCMTTCHFNNLFSRQFICGFNLKTNLTNTLLTYYGHTPDFTPDYKHLREKQQHYYIKVSIFVINLAE